VKTLTFLVLVTLTQFASAQFLGIFGPSREQVAKDSFDKKKERTKYLNSVRAQRISDWNMAIIKENALRTKIYAPLSMIEKLKVLQELRHKSCEASGDLVQIDKCLAANSEIVGFIRSSIAIIAECKNEVPDSEFQSAAENAIQFLKTELSNSEKLNSQLLEVRTRFFEAAYNLQIENAIANYEFASGCRLRGPYFKKFLNQLDYQLKSAVQVKNFSLIGVLQDRNNAVFNQVTQNARLCQDEKASWNEILVQSTELKKTFSKINPIPWVKEVCSKVPFKDFEIFRGCKNSIQSDYFQAVLWQKYGQGVVK
jgi:hypothetical protein